MLKHAWLLALGVSAWAGTPLGMIASFDQTPPPELRLEMEREFALVLQPFGISPVWLSLENAWTSSHLPPALIVMFHGACSSVPRSAHFGPAISLAQTSAAEGTIQPFVGVDCDEVGKIVPTEEEAGSNRVLGRALARVLAHEAYHVLVQTREHTGAGITKSVQTTADLTRAFAFFDRTSSLLLRKATRRMYPVANK